MKSGMQRRTELAARKKARLAKSAKQAKQRQPIGTVPVNREALAPNNSYGSEFELRGYYADYPFDCMDCGKPEVWTAAQQKWWYEVAKGTIYTTARRCRACRRRERERKSEARQVHLEGIIGKQKQ